MQSTQDKYYNILKHVLKPARYIGGEINQIVKNQYDVHFCLAFPDSYEIGMSHLGLRILYHYLNQNPAIFAERVFAPWPDLEVQLRKEQIPLLSLETKTPLLDFDAVGFSFQYELEYTNVLTMLDVSGIPIHSRSRDESHPIVLAGGPVVVNPEPMSEFIDAFVIGDGEDILEKILLEIRDGKGKKLTRQNILHKISTFDGVYVPQFYGMQSYSESHHLVRLNDRDEPFKIKKHLLDDINRYPFPADIIIPHTEIVHDRISIEIARGCTQGCRFCQAGFIYRPVRERSTDSIFDSIESSMRNTGYKDVSLTSLSPADYSAVRPMIAGLSEAVSGQDISLHLSSLRVYGLTRELTEQMATGRKTGFTIAPEAGSQRMRDVINKNITEDDIMQATENAFSGGWELIKLYTMIGLPTETLDDVDAIAEMAIKIFRLGRKIIGKRARINLAVATFIPKPFTPFQWAPLISREELNERQELLKKKLIPFKKIKFNFPSYNISLLEGILSRGDSSAAGMIERAWRNGARFDAWRDQFDFAIWEEAMAHNYPRQIPFVNGFKENDFLPWEHIDVGVTKEFLLKEQKKSQQNSTTPPCEQPLAVSVVEKERKISEDKPYVCYNCGLNCSLDDIREFQKNNLTDSRRVPDFKLFSDEMRPQNETRYIAQFSKKPPIHLLSHLDQYGVFKRLFTRAGIRIKYSEGFRPRPVISMPGALGLGVISLDEWMMFTLQEEWDDQALLEQLNRFTPEGLSFHQIRKTQKKIDWTRHNLSTHYQIDVMNNGTHEANFSQKIHDYISRDEWVFTKEKKKRSVAYDLKKFYDIEKFENKTNVFSVNVIQHRDESGTPSVADFMGEVLGLSAFRYQIIKLSSAPHPF